MQEGGRGGGGTNKRPGTDHVISGQIRGLEENCTNGAEPQTDGLGNSLTETAQLGQFSEDPTYGRH